MILFDYGGTLDTRARHWAHILWEGYREAGIPVTEAQFREAYVYGERALARHPLIRPQDDFHTLLFKKMEQETRFLLDHALWRPTAAEREAACLAVARYADGYARRCVDESRRVLEKLRRGGRKMVVVSNFYGNLPTVLRTYGLDCFFAAVVESAVVGVRKPDPAIFRLGVEALGCRAGEAVVVGDSYAKDIVPAKQAGCRAVWFKGEEWAEEVRDESLPDAVITSLDQLPGVLDRLPQAADGTSPDGSREQQAAVR